MSEKNVIIKGDVAYMPRSMASVKLNAGSTSATPGNTPSNPIQKIDTGFGDVAPWGSNNLFPQTVINEAEYTFLPTVLEKQGAMLYGGGVQYGELNYDDNGEDVFIPARDPEVEQFMRRSSSSLHMLPLINDFYWFRNCFPEIILSKDRSKVTSIGHQEATFCRWALQNSKGIVERCYIHGNWENVGDEKEAITVPVIDPFYNPVETLKAGKSHKFIYPISYPSPGKVFYQLASWNSVRKNGWMEVYKAIPEFKKALFSNQITFKYHIEVATWYWEWKYPGFERLKPEEKLVVMDEELQGIQDTLTGNDNAAKTVITATRVNPVSGKVEQGWIITPIDNKLKDGIYIEDSQEATLQILFAAGIDHTLIGGSIAKGMGAGSGSDKREAFNMYMSLTQPHVDLILSPWVFADQYNGWNKGKGYHWRFKRPYLQTKDQVTPKKRENTYGS